jgi:hypothetical protein
VIPREGVERLWSISSRCTPAGPVVPREGVERVEIYTADIGDIDKSTIR